MPNQKTFYRNGGHWVPHDGSNTLDPATLGSGVDAAKIADGSVSNAEFQYLDGVTSSIQAQLNALATGAGRVVVELTNQSGATIEPGSPVYVDSNGDIAPSRANSTTTASCFGVAGESIADTAAGDVVTEGPVTLTTGQWDARTGGSGGLTPGADYWVSSAAAGALVTTPPTTSGQQQTYVGQALSTTVLYVRPEPWVGM